MKHILSLLFLWCFATALQPVHALENSDREAIHQIVAQFTEGWNRSSGKELAEHYLEDADFVNIFGMLFSGKHEIEERHTRILDTFMKGSSFEVTDQQLREVHPGLVIAHVRWRVTDIPPSEKSSFQSSMEGILIHVFVKDPEGWSIAATQNTLKS